MTEATILEFLQAMRARADERFDALEVRLGRIEERLERLELRVTAVEQHLATMLALQASDRDEVAKLTRRVERLERRLELSD